MLVFLFEDFFENIQFKNCSSFNIFFSFSRRTKLCVKQSGNYSNLKLKCMKYFHLRVNPVSRTRAVQLLHWILNLSICFALRFHAFMYLEKIWSRLLLRIHAKESYIIIYPKTSFEKLRWISPVLSPFPIKKYLM